MATTPKSLIEREEDGTVKLTITLPKDAVKKAREEVTAEIVKQVNLPGFRKGKAPQKLAEDKINQETVVQETLKRILPQAYAEAVQEHSLRPIMNPKIHIEKVEPDTDWVFVALTCEMPTVDLGNYKKAVKDVTAKSKIAIPGKEPQKPSMDEVVKALLGATKVSVPEVLLEQETDRHLAQLLEDIKKLGLSLDQYLGTTNRSAEDLRNEYKQRAENDIKLEFILQKIAETEKIVVEEREIEEAIQKAKDPNEKKNLEGNRYLLAGILRQQKTLDFLLNL
jgi:trigger factor